PAAARPARARWGGEGRQGGLPRWCRPGPSSDHPTSRPCAGAALTIRSSMQGQLSTKPQGGSQMPLTLQEAQTVIIGAHERAAQAGALVTVAVVDEGGHLQALGRMNGAAPLSAQIAETKAASVALFRRDGSVLRQMQEDSPGFFAQLGRAVPTPIL